MVMSDKISRYIVKAAVCLLLPAAGCAQTATLALKFTPQGSTTYKVTTETEDSIKFEGSLLDDPELKSKSNQRNHNRVEITFTQQIQSIDHKGDAIVNITIEELKCLTIYQNNPVLDFDSSRETDRDNPLNKLVGQSYTIKIAPTGQVVKVIDANEARNAVGKGLPSSQRALTLLSDDVIKKHHTIQALPAAERNRLHIGDNWSTIEMFSFRQMGSKSYEKIYTLKEIKNLDIFRLDQGQLAIVQMSAIPSSEMAEELHKEQAMDLFSNMFDNIETYTGKLRFDLTAGRVGKYHEELRTEWITAEPNPKNDEEPGVIRMRAIRSHSLEKIN